MSPHASVGKGTENLNHTALTKHHENLARSMQAKAEEQKKIIKSRSRFSKFGRNAQSAKKRVLWRIHNYEKAAEVNFAKAAYHKKIAREQGRHDTHTNSDATKEQIDKASFRLDKSTPVNSDGLEDAL
ncbi:hypothetical protein [Nitrosomonas sp. Nm51]|uniref:hypothetical protein n=1 Tax=Nitrosomonas sp. Nm51 TaxID=133720 RepID=UPI0011600A64|nr:hypothetical protein [Nitrosomonas sp. Nm51]